MNSIAYGCWIRVFILCGKLKFQKSIRMTDRNESLKIIFSRFCGTKIIYFKYREKRISHKNTFLKKLIFVFLQKTRTEDNYGPRLPWTDNFSREIKNGSKSSEKIAERSVYFVFYLFFTKICHSISLRWFYCLWNIRFWSLRIFLRPFEYSISIFTRCYRIWSFTYCIKIPTVNVTYLFYF